MLFKLVDLILDGITWGVVSWPWGTRTKCVELVRWFLTHGFIKLFFPLWREKKEILWMEKGVQWRMSNPSEMFWFNNDNFFFGSCNRLIEEADYKSTTELFAKRGDEKTLDNFIPKSESDFVEYAELISHKLRSYEVCLICLIIWCLVIQLDRIMTWLWFMLHNAEKFPLYWIAQGCN